MVDWFSLKFMQLASKNLDRGIVYVTLANFGTAILGAVLWLLLASIFPPSQYGEINYYISIGAVASVFGVFGLATVNTTYLSKKSEKELDGIYVISFFIALTASAVVWLLTFSFFTALLTFSIVGFSMSTSVSLGMKNYKEFMILMISERALRIVFVLSGYSLLGLQGVILGYAMAYLVLSYKFFSRLLKSRLSSRIIREKRGFASHAFSMDIAQSSQIFFDKLFIGPLFGFMLLGLYQISTQFLMVLAIIPSSLFFYLLPKEASGEKSNRIHTIAIVVAAMFALIFFAAAEIIIKTFFAQYIEAVPIAQIVVFGVIPMTIISSSNSKLLGSGNSNYVFLGALVFLTIQFLSLIILVEKLGDTGLALSLLIALSGQASFLKLVEKIKAHRIHQS